MSLTPTSDLEQKEVLLQTPLLLNALLNVSIARTWLLPTLATMRLFAAFAQALPPSASERLRLTQLPGISAEDIAAVAPKAKDLSDVLHSLEEKNDPRSKDVKKTLEKWGRVEIVEAAFKGESSTSDYCWFESSWLSSHWRTHCHAVVDYLPPGQATNIATWCIIIGEQRTKRRRHQEPSAKRRGNR